MRLNEIADNAGARSARKRRGRGVGSGLGKTSGVGQKGQKSRSGVAIKGYEGGQMPLHMRIPKRGFNKPNRAQYVEVTLERLQRALDAGRLDAGKPVDAAALLAAGLFKKERDGVRLLASGTLNAGLTLTVAGASKAAVEAVEKAGGSVTIAPKAKAKVSESEEPASADKAES